MGGAGAAQLVDVTFPGDPIISTSNNSPGSHGVANAIDDELVHTYLNFDRVNTGLTVFPRLGLTLVSGLTLTSADGPSDRDPTSYTLEGSHDAEHFTLISSGSLPAFPARFFKHTVVFENDRPYRQYRLIFPTINGSSCCMQIAEIELLGERGPRDVTAPGDWITSAVTNSPGSDNVANAIDDQPTKYSANLASAGLIVAPAAGPTVVSGLTLTSAENSPERDPASYALEGSNDGTQFALISRGNVPPFPRRFFTNIILFPENTNSYRWYRLTFPTVNGSPCCVEIAEVEFLGRGPGVPPCAPTQGQLIRQHPVDAFVWPGFTATFQVVLTESWRVQWFRNGQRIPAATGPTYVTPPTTAADEGARFYAEVEGPTCERSDEVAIHFTPRPPGQSIGFNWVGRTANGAPTELTSNDVAGFVPQAYWNNLAGATGTLTGPANNSNEVHATITIHWQTSGEWGNGTGVNTPAGRLLNGLVVSPYPFANPTESSVTLTGVPPGHHSLLLYTVQPPGEFWYLDFSATTYHTNGEPNQVQRRFVRPQEANEYITSPGFLLVTAEIASQREAGNLLRFDSLQPENGRIEVRFLCPGPVPMGSDFSARGPGLNALQLMIDAPPVGCLPAFTQQPSSANGVVDGQVTLSAAAGCPDVVYQWYKENQPIRGATNAQLVLARLAVSDAGRYSVAIQNSAGRTRSREVVVDVLATNRVTDRLAIHLTFDDGAGVVATNAVAGQPSGAILGGNGPPSWPAGRIGRALQLDGDMYVLVPDYPKGISTLTVAGWIAPLNDEWGPIANNWLRGPPLGQNGQFQIEIAAVNDPILNPIPVWRGQVGAGPSFPVVSAAVEAPPGTWRHFAMTANGLTASFYWNGRRVAETGYRGEIIASPNLPPWISIGAEFTEAGFPTPERTLAARLDDFAVWGRSLSEIEIEAIYRAGLSGRNISEIPAVLDVRLTISGNAGVTMISWPIDLSGYVLQTSPNLSPPAWTPVPGVVSNRVTLAHPTGTAFFRLAAP